MKLFKNYTSKESQEISLEQVFDLIHNDEEVKKITELHRDLLAKGHEQAAKEVKFSTPQVAVSFQMEGGKGVENCCECLYYVLIDFDAKAPGERLPADELEWIKTTMRTSYHTALGYESISGLGYHSIVPFRLPDGITIDMKENPQRSSEIFMRVHHYINNVFSVWCKHEMDKSCKNANRMAGLSHDPLVVYRPDAMPFFPTREELGIDSDGNLIRMRTPKTAIDRSGNHIAVPLGDRLERAVKMVEDSGMAFVVGNRHNFVMRIAFILNRMGVDEDEAAQALDDAYKGKMDGRPSNVLHSCYKTAADEFGMWLSRMSKKTINSEIIAAFIKQKSLKYDLLTQKTYQLQENGGWKEVKKRDENNLYLECCSESSKDFTQSLFETVLNSNVVPEENPLKDYIMSLPAWTPDKPDYIALAAGTVHMASDDENNLWQHCFKKWFVAMVDGWIDVDVVNHQVIVLIGRQGIFKSTWINRLLPPCLRAYSTDNFDVERLDKDEQLRAAEYGLINIDELDKFSDRQLNKIKTMTTTLNVDVRAAYGHHKEKRVRVASYAASGNKEEFLTDQTGNRRWLPFHVDSIDSPFEHELPYEGMYAQARYLLEEENFNYWFDVEETDNIKAHIENFMVQCPEEQLVPLLFSPIQPGQPGAEFLSLAEIAAKICIKGNLRNDGDYRRLGTIMKKMKFVPDRKGRQGRRGYYVLEHTINEQDAQRDPNVK